MTYRRILAAATLALAALPAQQASAQATDPFLGQIAWVPYNFEPRGWHFCDGAILPIAQNTALFALLGTTYGGDGQVTFALPDLRGRFMISSGQGPGLTDRTLGEMAGEETVTLSANQMPVHSHAAYGVDALSGSTSPAGAFPGKTAEIQGGAPHSTNVRTFRKTGDPVAMAAGMIGTAGGSQPHDNMPPYTTLNCIIALEGVFPARN